MHSRISLVTVSGTSSMASGIFSDGMVTACSAIAMSRHEYPWASASSFSMGKCSFAKETLYSNGACSAGKNSPYLYTLPPLSVKGIASMCSIIFLRKTSYSSLLYCLFKMQYCLFFNPTHPKQFWIFLHIIQYCESITSDQHEHKNWELETPRPEVAFSYARMLVAPQIVMSCESWAPGT